MNYADNLNNKLIKTYDTVIIGGGPAGMEAGRIATIRGHKVTIFEKESVTGGLAASANFKGYYFE